MGQFCGKLFNYLLAVFGTLKKKDLTMLVPFIYLQPLFLS